MPGRWRITWVFGSERTVCASENLTTTIASSAALADARGGAMFERERPDFFVGVFEDHVEGHRGAIDPAGVTRRLLVPLFALAHGAAVLLDEDAVNGEVAPIVGRERSIDVAVRAIKLDVSAHLGHAERDVSATPAAGRDAAVARTRRRAHARSARHEQQPAKRDTG